MTQDEIIEMARQAGYHLGIAKHDIELLETFAKLVAAKAIAELESQETVAINWNAIYEKLELVWYRELSADEGLDEIQDLIDTHPPQRTEPLIGCVNHDCAKCKELESQETVALEALVMICVKCRSNEWGSDTPRKQILNWFHDTASKALEDAQIFRGQA